MDRVLEVSALFREYASLVERVLRRAGVEARDVPDARQEVFLVAHRRLSEFEGRAQPSTWLCAIAIRVASDFRRKAHRRRERPEGAQSASSLADSAQAELPEQRDDLLQALQALERIAPPQREVFVLFELFELPMNEVAARVGCPSKTAFSRLYSARRQLQSELRKRGLLAGACPLFPVERSWSAGAREALRAGGEVLARGGASWPTWIAGAAALALMVGGPHAGVTPAQGPNARPAAQERTESADNGLRALTPARPLEVDAARSRASGAERLASRGVRSKRRARQVQPANAPPTALPGVARTDDDDDFRVTRASANDPTPAGEHPWAYLLPPEAREPARLRLRGPADPADMIEDELREF